MVVERAEAFFEKGPAVSCFGQWRGFKWAFFSYMKTFGKSPLSK